MNSAEQARQQAAPTKLKGEGCLRLEAISHAVIRRAFELGKELIDTNTENEKTDKGNLTNNTIPYNKPTNTAASSIAKAKVITAVSRLGKDISNIFRQEFDGYANDPALRIDSKLRREIEAKKKGQNISM